MDNNLKEIKLSKIKVRELIDYRNTENNFGKYTVRYIIHKKLENTIFDEHKIHIIKNRRPIIMISLHCEELDIILKSLGFKLVNDINNEVN